MDTPENAFDISNVAIPWSDQQGGAGAVCCSGGRVQYAVPASGALLTLLSADASKYQSSHTFSDLNVWSAKKISDQFPPSLHARFVVQTDQLMSIFAVGDYTFVFWTSQDGHRYALRTRPDMLEPAAVAEIDFSVWGNNHTVKSNVAAFALPSTLPSLAGKIGAVVLAEEVDSGNQTVRGVMLPLLFDPADFTPNGTWAAQIPNGGHRASLGSLLASDTSGRSVVDDYPAVSAGWIDQGIVKGPHDSAPRPYMSLVVVCNNNSSSIKSLSFGMDLLSAFDAYFLATHGGNLTVTKINAEHGDSGLSFGANVGMAPDGSLSVHFRDGSDNVRVGKLIPNSAQPGEANYQQPGLYLPVWETSPVYLASSTSHLTTRNTPCGVYLPLATTRGPSPSAVMRSDGSGAQVFDDCPSVRFIHLILSSDSNYKPRLSTSYWGAFFSIENYRIDTATDDYQQATLVSMVADSFPYPVPSREIWGPDSPSGMVNWQLCNYEYLTGDDTEVDLDYSFQLGVGLKAEAIVTTVVGVQADAEDVAGISALVQKSDATLKASSFSVATRGLPPVAGDPETETLRLSPSGAFFGVTPPARMATNVTLLQPRGGASSSFLAVTVQPIMDGTITARSGGFQSYCYIPGQLQTYDPASIGSTMANRFSHLSADDKQRFRINGVDYSSLYQADYVERVAEKFGRNCFGPGGNLPYLEFSFSESGIQRSEFQSTSRFTAGGGAYANHSAYAGLAWNEEVENSVGALGVYEVTIPIFNSSGYLMVGVEWATSLVASSTSTKSWGVKLGEYLTPLAPGEAYTVRMYLLEPSPLWALEMKYFGFNQGNPTAEQIDFTNSSPVRILFTVPYISPALQSRLARGV
ncbi:hypothetical protein [Corallococcus sp. AS-1-12]|uniref:hypothetical protein n=1 Tax=Corallococcus sp. AS-1-12 TaxID=2874598 RepID=UPI001CBB7522|nr:hypothetical protein [Corallococcus sp. AS-1-12]MBZ4336085.1 hypothetical protein [Corallococcus sp. AS-1-12]